MSIACYKQIMLIKRCHRHRTKNDWVCCYMSTHVRLNIYYVSLRVCTHEYSSTTLMCVCICFSICYKVLDWNWTQRKRFVSISYIFLTTLVDGCRLSAPLFNGYSLKSVQKFKFSFEILEVCMCLLMTLCKHASMGIKRQHSQHWNAWWYKISIS